MMVMIVVVVLTGQAQSHDRWLETSKIRRVHDPTCSLLQHPQAGAIDNPVGVSSFFYSFLFDKSIQQQLILLAVERFSTKIKNKKLKNPRYFY
jgi:hypothetical protein